MNLTGGGETIHETKIEPEDEDYYDPTCLTFEIGGNTLFRGGLKYLCEQQEFTQKPMHMALVDYDVVISVTEHRENENLIVDEKKDSGGK